MFFFPVNTYATTKTGPAADQNKIHVSNGGSQWYGSDGGGESLRNLAYVPYKYSGNPAADKSDYKSCYHRTTLRTNPLTGMRCGNNDNAVTRVADNVRSFNRNRILNFLQSPVFCRYRHVYM